MQPTSQQQLPFKLIQLDYQWLTHFFDTLLLLFEPMLSNPFCLKIISDDEGNQSTSNNPHEILSHMTVESPIFGLIKDKIESIQQGPFQSFSVYMLIIVSKIALSILRIEKSNAWEYLDNNFVEDYCIGKSELFRILNFCETETLDFIKTNKLPLHIKNKEEVQVGDKEYSCQEFLNKNLSEIQEETKDLAELFEYLNNVSSCNIIDIKRGTLYSENKKRFDLGYAFSFAKDHSNLDENQLKYDHQIVVNNQEILLLNIKQDEVSEIFHEKNKEVLSHFRVIVTTAYTNDKIRDECTNRQTLIFSNIKYKNLKHIAGLLNKDISASLNFVTKHNQTKTTIKVISSLQSFGKESFYLSSQDSRNPILSHNYYLIITTENPPSTATVSKETNEFCQLIYYNYGSNDAILKAKNYWIDGLLKKLLHILQTKKVIHSENCFEKDLVEHYQKIVKEEKNIELPSTWFEDNTKNQKFILKEFVQVLSQELELLYKNSDHQEILRIDDYVGKKYVLKESFKLVKLIFLHKYGVVI